MTESLVEKQVRLVLERQCRAIGAELKPKMPAGVGFLLFLSDFGADGNMAYVSTVERDSAIKLVQEWLDHQDANHPAEGWETLAMFTAAIAEAVGLDPASFESPQDVQDLVQRCRDLYRKANK